MIKKINVAITGVVDLIYNTGNIISESSSNVLDGQKYHRFVQNKYQEDDRKEVYINEIISKDNFEYNFNGRIDGVLFRDTDLIINEIKTTRVEINKVEDLIKIKHLYQAMLYGAIYLKKYNLDKCIIRITYINIDTEAIKEFDFSYNILDLRSFFEATCEEYHNFNMMITKYQENKIKQIKLLRFPFQYLRKGQKELMIYNMDNIKSRDIIYIVAPTGIGKTVSLLYSSLKVLEEENDKIFYLTSKNSLKKIALDTLEIFSKQNLEIKSIELTSKEKICFLKDKKDCKNCPYIKDYYNKLYQIIVEVFLNYNILTKEIIEEIAFKYDVCPFELSLDLSNYQDIIISDYNYAFCPKSHLIRYFDTQDYNNILLVDEAHNLVSRSQNMYSSYLSLNDIFQLKEFCYYLSTAIKNELQKLISYINYKRNNEKFYIEENIDDELLLILSNLCSSFEECIENERFVENEKEILTGYFQFKEFIKISGFFNDNFKVVFDNLTEDFLIKILCLDASDYILKTIRETCKSCSFFSATLSPLNYYKTLLTKNEGTEIVFNSNFDNRNFLVLNYRNIDLTYHNRDFEISKIHELIECITSIKQGNYICFFPSYSYMKKVYETSNYKDLIYLQEQDDTYLEKEAFIQKFLNDENHKIGFFVMGGSFSEGIDYIGEKLIGVFIFSLCLPKFNQYTESNKKFYDEKFNQGYDYAYKFKSLEKVIQASGRVIRSEEDYGFCILVDPRFDSYQYKRYFPNNFKNYYSSNNLKELEEKIVLFYEEKHKM